MKDEPVRSKVTHAENILLSDLDKPKKKRKVKKAVEKLGPVKTSKKLNMRATPIYSVAALERYQDLHEKVWAAKHPGAYADRHYFFDMPVGTYTNRLTMMCKYYLEWCGHEANRIDTKGTAKIDKNHAPKFNIITGKIQTQTKIDFIPTQTKTGTEDLSVKLVHSKHRFGVPWAIEIKALKDSQSDAQKEREEELTSKGLWYDIVKHLDMFFELYDQKMYLLDNE